MENKKQNEVEEFLKDSPYSENEKSELTLYISGLTPAQEDILLESQIEEYKINFRSEDG